MAAAAQFESSGGRVFIELDDRPRYGIPAAVVRLLPAKVGLASALR